MLNGGYQTNNRQHALIHANAFHMKVNIEPLNLVKDRAESLKSKIVKIVKVA